MTDVSAALSRCHQQPLVISDVSADADGPARRYGTCPECGLCCWTIIDAGELVISEAGSDADGSLVIFKETFDAHD
jgi:hypothetical protein